MYLLSKFYINPLIHYQSLNFKSIHFIQEMSKSTCLKFCLIIITTFLLQIHAANVTCLTNNTLVGCISCAAALNHFRVINVQTNLYECNDVVNCATALNNGTCISCVSTYFLSLNTQTCVIQKFCLTYDPITLNCTECIPNYLIVNGKCINSSVTYCQTYNQNTSLCTRCAYGFMDVANDCKVNALFCSNFDYTNLKCLQCPKDTYLDVKGQFCLQKLENCLIASQVGCIKCQQQYAITLDANNKLICGFNQQIDYQFFIEQSTSTCLNKLSQYSATNLTNPCQKTNSAITYCAINDAFGNCTLCITGYFLQSPNKCSSCRLFIDNCIFCAGPFTCQACLPTNFLLNQIVSGLSKTTCRQCSTYGCQKCMSLGNSVVCLECQRGQTLFNYSCYNCSSGTRLNRETLQCTLCPSNCASCSQIGCIWCNQNYILLSSGTCTLTNSVLSSQLTSTGSVYQMLVKAFPQHQNLIFKDSLDLMSSCQQSANMFTCLCSSSVNKTSLCYTIGINVSKFDLLSVFGALTIINGATFLQNYQTLRLMAQVPAFDALIFTIQSTTLIPENKLSALLQIYTQILRRKTSGIASSSPKRLLLTVNDVLNQLFSLVSGSLSETLSLTETTVIYGNGYYFKFYPKGGSVTDLDSSFVSLNSRNTSQIALIFVWFQNTVASKSLTGNIYVYTPSSSHSQALTIRQLKFPAGLFTYKFYKNDELVEGTQVSKSTSLDNFLVIKNVMTSTKVDPIKYNVVYQESAVADVEKLYSGERIQFIFYQSAFIYLLIFLVIYLFLIPCCSLVDIIENKSGHRRKKVRSEDLSMTEQAKNQYEERQQQSSESSVVISVNYKDFFPIYNICNTPRPRRILKLCLFLLNAQHSITFLTLIYFNLEPDHPVIAVILGLPAYFCTIIMGYICGVLTLVLPGWSKYSINFIVVGYWIIWIVLMPRFQSQQYQPYVFIFAIVFFAIDMIIDLLQMFMVYFTIKQTDRQIKMFKCLATWLSKRGYYEYDKLAKQLNEA